MKKKRSKRTPSVNIKFGRWYNEYGGFHIHDFISIMIHQFPILVFRRYRDHHDPSYPHTYSFALLGFTLGYGPVERG